MTPLRLIAEDGQPVTRASEGVDARRRDLRGELLAKAAMAAVAVDQLIEAAVGGNVELMVAASKQVEALGTLMGETCRRYQRAGL